MTFIEAVNRVLLRMRETEVTGWDDNSYSRLIGRLVNDAKREVENTHQWAGLKTLVDKAITSTDTSVVFEGTNKRTRIIDIYNDTDDCRLHRRDRDTIERWRQYAGGSQTGAPTWWGFSGHDSSGNIQVELWPTSDGSYTLTCDCILPQNEITTNNTEITIPGDAVYLRATALALAERGDDQGQNFAQLMNEYQIALNDAIVQDKDNSFISDAWINI